MKFVVIIIILALVAIYVYVGRDGCKRNEGYADQVMHGVAGGIAGPILPDSYFVPPVPKNIPMLMKYPNENLP
jgi:hypothetical protein